MKKQVLTLITLVFCLLNIKSYSQTLIADAGLDSLICSGSSMVLGGFPAASGGTPSYNYNWTPTTGLNSSTIPNPVASPTSTTTYLLTVTDTLGDTATAYVVVMVSVPIANAGIDQITCMGDSIQLNGNGGVSYSWSPTSGLSDPNIPNPIAVISSTTTYTLTAWDQNGCSATDDVTISLASPGLNLAISTSPASCAGCADGSASAIVSGGSSPYAYLWAAAPPNTSQTINGLTTGTYTVTITDANGCTITRSFTISVGQCMADFTLVPDTTLLHHYFIINNSVGNAPIQYVWNWGDGTPQDSIAYPSHTFSNAGFYSMSLSISDSGNCTSTYVLNAQVLRTHNSIISVDVIAPLSTGINESLTNNNLIVYPNPATHKVNISSLQGSTIEIYNMQGEKVKALSDFSGNSTIDVSDFSDGIYLIRCRSIKGIYKTMFVKE